MATSNDSQQALSLNAAFKRAHDHVSEPESLPASPGMVTKAEVERRARDQATPHFTPTGMTRAPDAELPRLRHRLNEAGERLRQDFERQPGPQPTDATAATAQPTSPEPSPLQKREPSPAPDAAPLDPQRQAIRERYASPKLDQASARLKRDFDRSR